MAEIHVEISELLDKQVNVQKESLKIPPGFLQAHEKVCDENERRKEGRKNNYSVKFFVVKGRTL